MELRILLSYQPPEHISSSTQTNSFHPPKELSHWSQYSVLIYDHVNIIVQLFVFPGVSTTLFYHLLGFLGINY